MPTSYFEDIKNRVLYIGHARAKGLHYFKYNTSSFDYILFPDKNKYPRITRNIIQISENKLLVLSDNGFYNLLPNDRRMTKLKINHIESPNFVNIAEDRRGEFWVCGATEGLYNLNLESNKLEVVSKLYEYFRRKELNPEILEISIDYNNNIWFRSKWLYGYYNPISDKLLCFDKENDPIILDFFNDTDTIWVGLSGKGIGFINVKHPELGVQMYKVKLNKSITSISKDSLGNFVMLSRSGIEILAPDKQSTVIFNEDDGLIKYSKWENRDPTENGKLVKLADGSFAILYRRGLGFFNTCKLQKNLDVQKPFISSIKVFGKEIGTDGETFARNSINLNYNQNFLSIEYSALSLKNGKNLIFSHQLYGVDNNWVKYKQNIANYVDLPPGNYKFAVRTTQKSDSNNFAETYLSIYISPPWWKTWWTYTIYVLVFILIVYSIYKYQLKRELEHNETSRLKEVNNLKSRLYTNITHEFRTPLTVIRGMVDEMKENINEQDNEQQEDKLEMIGRNSDKLLYLVKQILDLSKIEDGKMKVNLIQDNIVYYLQYIIESFQSMADTKNVKLVFYHETDNVIMDYDQDKIFIISSNLLSNAIKFTPSGGKVIFHVKREKVESDNNFIIKVQDTGIGIDEQSIQHIFDRFYQVDNSSTRKGEGTGIGLALTKELVEILNGKISVESIPNTGTKFRIKLPITNKATIKKSQPIEIEPFKSQNNVINFDIESLKDNNYPLALIVEDNKDVAVYIKSCLSNKYKVIWAANGKQGIETAIKIVPDIIISDVMMPEKDGFELCETLKKDEHTSHIPIILLTAKATHKDRIVGLSFGADAYLTKPFDKQELFIRIEQLIKIRLQLQEKFSNVDVDILDNTKPVGEEVFLQKVITLIKENLDNEGLNSTILAKGLFMSESQLYRKIKALNNKSVSIFIRSIRLSVAKQKLKTSSFTISEIAYQCGFSNPTWFSRSFKEEYKVSPSEYRKKA